MQHLAHPSGVELPNAAGGGRCGGGTRGCSVEWMGDLASLVRTGRVPLTLYGLPDDFAGARTVAGVGRHDDVVNLVSLGHGDRVDESAAWVQVTVCGPLHGHGDQDAAIRPGSIDPLPMIAGELLGL